MSSMLKASAALFFFMISATSNGQMVTIKGARLSGTGCNSASASATMTADGQILSILFDNYVAEIGIGSKNPQINQIKLSCTVFVDVNVPAGYQYAITETNYQGFSALPASAYGLHRFTQVIPNQSIPSMREAQLRGPINQNYSVLVRQKPGREIYSTCNNPDQTIQLLSELQLAYLPGTTDRSLAMINLDSIDTGVNSRFKLLWRKCK